MREPYVVQVTLPLDKIEVRERSRIAVGRIDSLAESIRCRGLLHPPVVRRVGDAWVLVAGQRRLEALRLLGFDRTLVTVVDSGYDQIRALHAEGEENTERQPFTPEEAVRHRKRIEALVAAEAKERQGTRTDLGQELSSKLDERPEHERTTRHRTAKGTGFSATTLDKAAEVVDAAQDETLPEPVRQAAAEARAEMNETGKVDPAHRKVRAAINDVMDGALDPAEAERQRLARTAARLLAAYHEGLLALDAKSVAALVDPEMQIAWRQTAEQSARWWDELTKSWAGGLRVVEGGR